MSAPSSRWCSPSRTSAQAWARDASVAERLHLRPLEHDARLEPVEQLVLVPRPAVLRDELDRRCSSRRGSSRSYGRRSAPRVRRPARARPCPRDDGCRRRGRGPVPEPAAAAAPSDERRSERVELDVSWYAPDGHVALEDLAEPHVNRPDPIRPVISPSHLSPTRAHAAGSRGAMRGRARPRGTRAAPPPAPRGRVLRQVVEPIRRGSVASAELA